MGHGAVSQFVLVRAFLFDEAYGAQLGAPCFE